MDGPAPGAGEQVDLSPSGDGALLFMHIAKTAGTSMRKSLEHAYDPAERVFIYDAGHVHGALSIDAFGELPESRRRDARLLFGHFAYGAHRAVPRPHAYVATVRDPVDRAISLYYHYRFHKGLRYRLTPGRWRTRDPSAVERELIERSAMSLEDWVFERRRREVDNVMVRLISGRSGVGFGDCDEDMLSAALQNIDDDFVALLVQEDLAGSRRVLESAIGRSLPVGRRRKANRRRVPIEDVDIRVRERIAELNALDVRLYQLARERLAGIHA